MMTILHFLLPEVGAIIKLYLKNPKSLSGLSGVIAEIITDLTTIQAGINS